LFYLQENIRVTIYISSGRNIPEGLNMQQHRRRNYRGAGKSLARPRRKQARKHVRDGRDFNNIETRAIKFLFLQGKAPKEIHAILTETLACFFPGRTKDLSAPLYDLVQRFIFYVTFVTT